MQELLCQARLINDPLFLMNSPAYRDRFVFRRFRVRSIILDFLYCMFRERSFRVCVFPLLSGFALKAPLSEVEPDLKHGMGGPGKKLCLNCVFEVNGFPRLIEKMSINVFKPLATNVRGPCAAVEGPRE